MTITIQVLEQSVVVFSRNYLPVSRVNVKRAIPLLVLGKAEPLNFTSETGWLIRSPNLVIAVPAHIRLTSNSTERLWRIPPVNRREVLRRDSHTCQYCGSSKYLTLDHVIPLSKGGQHSWNNVVTACKQCNQRKSNYTPLEAGMPLGAKPKAPVHPAVVFAEKFWREQQGHLESEETGQC